MNRFTTHGPALIVFALLSVAAATSAGQTIQTTDVPAKYLGGLSGGFVLYDMKANAITQYDSVQCNGQFSPGSTFDILNSLIGLETKVIQDEHFVIPWDSVPRSIPSWNRNHDLASAFTHSVAWYYQEVARRVGIAPMAVYIALTGYGNNSIAGRIDEFWVGKSLMISANEQISFLRKLHAGTLLFSDRSMDIVRRIMITEKTNAYVLREKTGFTSDSEGKLTGWSVGYVERGDNVYFFAMIVRSRTVLDNTSSIFGERMSITRTILKDLDVLK